MKIAAKTVQYSIYDRTNGGAKYIDDTKTYKRPELAMLSDSVAGAGLMGEIDLPTPGQIDAMEIEIGLNKTNEKAIELFTPVAHTIETRWVTNILNSANGNSELQANKEIIRFVPKGLDMGEIENNTTNEATLKGEVIAYEYIIGGKSYLKIDKLNNIFIVNGKDYSAAIRKAL